MCLDFHCCPNFSLAALLYALPGSPAPILGLLSGVSLPSVQPLSSPLFLPLSSASLLAQPGLPPSPPASLWWGLVLGSRVAWGDSERLECGKGGGWAGGVGSCGGQRRGFSLGWSEFSHLSRVQATGPCQADDITLQECLLLAQEAQGPGGEGDLLPEALTPQPSPLLPLSDSFSKPLISCLCLSDFSTPLFSHPPAPAWFSLGSSVCLSFCL